MKKKSAFQLYVSLFMCLVFVFSAVGCSNQGETSSSSDGDNVKDTLTVIVASDPANLDPNDSDAQQHYQVTRQIYETLFIYDENYELKPWLCESYEYEDDETIILNIRKGVKFHNGDELKASDVLFTFKRIIENKLCAMVEVSKLLIDQCEALDDYTLKLVTDGPVSTQLKLLESPAVGIMSERAYTEAGGDFLKGAAVGTGPYKFVSYDPGDKVVMEAHDEYWIEGQPHIKNLVMRVVGDSSSRAVEAETGGADIVYDISAKDIKRVGNAKNVEIISELGTNTSHLLFNTAMEPMDNDLVRQAVWYGVDVESAVEIAYEDFGQPASGWISPGIKGEDSEIVNKLPTRDVEKAKALLTEAGYPDGLTLSIVVSSSDQERCDMAETFQAQLAEVGIDLKIDIMESSAWNSHILEGKHQMTIYGFSCADFEADRALVQLMPSNVNYNICKFDNKEFQDLVNKSFITLDDDERFELYRKAQNLLIDNYITLPLWHKELNAAVQKGVKGFNITRSYEHHYLQNVYFE